MKRISFVVIVTMLMLQARTQLMVNLQLPPVGLILKSQLWNMALINSSGQTMTLRVEMMLTDVTNNVSVITGSSSQFDLPNGTRQMQVNDFGAIVYQVISPNYNVDNSPNGFLPVGNFNVCFSYVRVFHTSEEVIAEECETAAIEPLSPPMLVFPEDEAEIESPRPVFNWIPPAPSNLFSSLSYSLKLVEVMGTQTPADAIQQNVPIYTEQNISQPSMPYPAGLPALDTGKLYAWQIAANNNGSLIANSDIWSFRVGHFGNDPGIELQGTSFAKLRMDGSADYFLCSGILKFHYDNYFNDDTVRVFIRDLNNMQSPVFVDSTYRLGSGQNFKQLDISVLQAFLSNHMYQLELINSRNERWIGKFLYRRED